MLDLLVLTQFVAAIKRGEPWSDRKVSACYRLRSHVNLGLGGGMRRREFIAVLGCAELAEAERTLLG